MDIRSEMVAHAMTHPMKEGVVSSQVIRGAINAGIILADTAIPEDSIQPASLDLRASGTGYRLRSSFLPGASGVLGRLQEMSMLKFELGDGVVLEKGCVYLIPLMEHLNLPGWVHASANAKSSTGRLDLLTRIITENGTEFDRIPAGYCGPLYMEVCPLSFSILIRPGDRLSQIRFRAGNVVLSDSELEILHKRDPLIDHEAMISDGLGFSIDLSGDGIVGYRARPHSGAVDLRRIGFYDKADFWDPIHARNGRIILDPGAFYILMSKEAVRIPPAYAAEMAPYIPGAGEFRVHYAGFFDPGFGCSETGGSGSRGVLEVRCHDAPFLLEHGQTVGRLVFEMMSEIPDRLYGAGMGSNYQGQGLKLAKQFK